MLRIMLAFGIWLAVIYLILVWLKWIYIRDMHALRKTNQEWLAYWHNMVTRAGSDAEQTINRNKALCAKRVDWYSHEIGRTGSAFWPFFRPDKRGWAE